jgi:glycosyltransferase involved in cell wall biosynthesis
MTDKKITVLTLGDMPFSPSGVGIQTKQICEALLDSGKFRVVSIGGAVKHPQYKPVKTDKYEDDWIVYPVDGFGNADVIRSIMRNTKPDILWFMTDPRFYEWLWMMEDEIRPLIPMIYYHVWDNYPLPHYNKPWYTSTDKVVAISKVTHNVVKGVTPEVESEYLPHAVDQSVFKKMGKEEVLAARKDNFPKWENDKFLFLWNNRNARRKMSSSVIWWFNTFLDEVGRDKACLIMHTDPNDPNGPNLNANITKLDLLNGEVLMSAQKLPPEHLAMMYNMADCTINISDAEGFGLSTLESLACGTPIMVNMTGGLQEQVTDGENWFGVGIEPISKALVGSQNVPYIYEDRINEKQFVDALKEIYYTPRTTLEEMGEAGLAHVEKNYNFDKYKERWVQIMLDLHEKHGSWETRKNYKAWACMEV